MENKRLKNTLILILFSLLLLDCYLLFGNWNEGIISGRLIKFSKCGVLIKTYEGNFNSGNLSGKDLNSVVPTSRFSVHEGEDKVVEVLQQALATGKIVKVKYQEKFVHIFWRGDTRYFVVEAEIIK